jgi:hypothetical protein
MGGVEFPEVGFGAEEAAERPFAAEEGIDIRALFGRLRRKTGEILDLEAVEIFGVFAVAELGIGVEAGFESVLGGRGFAFTGARTGGFLRVEAVGVDLAVRGHMKSPESPEMEMGRACEGPSRFHGSRRGWGDWGRKDGKWLRD